LSQRDKTSSFISFTSWQKQRFKAYAWKEEDKISDYLDIINLCLIF